MRSCVSGRFPIKTRSLLWYEPYALFVHWVDLATAATLVEIWFEISTALSEIAVGKVIATGMGQIKTGSVSRGERIETYSCFLKSNTNLEQRPAMQGPVYTTAGRSL